MQKTIYLCLTVLFLFFINFTDITNAKVIKLTWSTVSVPNDAHTKAMEIFKTELEKITNRQIKVDIFHSGQLYTQEAELIACRRGILDMAYYGADWLSEFLPYVGMFGAAYTFKDYNHMSIILNGETGKKIFDDVAKKTGVRPLCAFYLGTRQLNLVKKVGMVQTPEKMKGVKLRTPGSPSWIALGKALGANPTPMSFSEVYIGLKTGVIDGQDNPLPTTKNARFYEVTKYIVLTDHKVDSVWPSMNEKKWQSLGYKLQQKVKQAIKVARNMCDKTNLATEADIIDFFQKKGMIIIKNPDKKAFTKHAKRFYMSHGNKISKNWDWNLYKKIESMR